MTIPQLILLVGPKGAGKTHIGTLLERRLGVRFIRVEPIYKRAQQEGADAIPEIVALVDDLANTPAPICIETTGASRAGLDRYLAAFAKLDVLPVRVHAPLEQCLRRVHERDQSAHIDVSDDLVLHVNRLAEHVRLDWVAEIDSSNDPTDDELVAVFEAILQR